MENPLEKIPQGAQKRRQAAEKNGELSLSHWRGELHSHTQTDISEPKLPDDIVEHRQGSNCGKVPLEALVRYHERAMKNDFIAITEHSRDANPAAGIVGMTKWFLEMYLSNEQWLRERFSKARENLSEPELKDIEALAAGQARQVALYGDERVEEILGEIDKLNQASGIKILKGVEASLLPDGSLDTQMPDKGSLEVVNCSIHPNLNQELFAPIIRDPDKYSELVLKGLANKPVNIMAHIGKGASHEVVEKLRWEEIAQSSIEHQVAMEINLQSLIYFIYDEILDYRKYPKNDKSWQAALRSKLKELVPILGSDNIGARLRPFFAQGLRIAINTDEHRNKFITSRTDEAGTKFNFIDRDFRYWRALKIVEQFFNEIFNDLGIRKEHIINTYSNKELKEFLEKNST